MTTDCDTQATQESLNTVEPSPYVAGLMMPPEPLVGTVIVPGTVHMLS